MNGDEIPDLLRLAKSVSLHSNYSIKIGAVIARKGKPIAVGFNKVRYHRTLVMGKSICLHAEMSCINTIDNLSLLRGCTIYTFRQHKNGRMAMARPCENCCKKLKEYGIKYMVYTTNTYPWFAIERL